jgi:hypothetical protein
MHHGPYGEKIIFVLLYIIPVLAAGYGYRYGLVTYR